jgi:hypothetical protein
MSFAPRTVPGHSIKWFVFAGGYGQPLTRLAKTAQMRGHWAGYDAECSCGWASNTGGAIQAYVKSEVDFHKWQAANDLAELALEARIAKGDWETGELAGHVECQECDGFHVAEFSHEGRFGEGPIFAVVCTVDHLTSYYTTEALKP